MVLDRVGLGGCMSRVGQIRDKERGRVELKRESLDRHTA